jgi:hypothetical protein
MQGWWGAPPKRRTEKQAGQYCGVAIVVIAVTLLGLDEGVIFGMHNAVGNFDHLNGPLVSTVQDWRQSRCT